MKKGNTVVEPVFRVTRARAAGSQSSGGPNVPKEQVPTRVLRNNPKRGVQDENSNSNATAMTGSGNKRRAVLKDVTNICRDNSYKNCIIPAKITRKTSLLTKKNQVNVPKVKAQKVSAESSEKETDVNAIQIDRIVLSQLQSFSEKGKSEINEKLVVYSKPNFTNIDNDHKDPQMCSIYAHEIYANLRVAEVMHRPRFDFMETIQQDVTKSMRGVLVDWLVEVSEEYKSVPETLYLAVYLIDLFLSQHCIERQKLQLLGVTCMLIASKYEEICAPAIEEFCFITDSTYTKSEVVKMESQVLNDLNFQLSAPTAISFLRRFLRAAQASPQIPGLELECLANYLAELTLVDYNFLVFVPSNVAASAVFLAKWMLDQSHHPWNNTLEHYTSYKSLDLKKTVLALHGLHSSNSSSPLHAIRSKYQQDKFKSVANLPSAQLPETLF
ncbi:cyclin-A2-1 [Artemisia annua]|uniref:Cyclin-A2-1 n=1 Tax=Artemisia annua TaxID=35608 RepID=A0A2U1QHG5_ARTAN|nr:cyclin-A2-1 [Artemisia annua]